MSERKNGKPRASEDMHERIVGDADRQQDERDVPGAGGAPAHPARDAADDTGRENWQNTGEQGGANSTGTGSSTRGKKPSR